MRITRMLTAYLIEVLQQTAIFRFGPARGSASPTTINRMGQAEGQCFPSWVISRPILSKAVSADFQRWRVASATSGFKYSSQTSAAVILGGCHSFMTFWNARRRFGRVDKSLSI